MEDLLGVSQDFRFHSSLEGKPLGDLECNQTCASTQPGGHSRCVCELGVHQQGSQIERVTSHEAFVIVQAGVPVGVDECGSYVGGQTCSIADVEKEEWKRCAA